MSIGLGEESEFVQLVKSNHLDRMSSDYVMISSNALNVNRIWSHMSILSCQKLIIFFPHRLDEYTKHSESLELPSVIIGENTRPICVCIWKANKRKLQSLAESRGANTRIEHIWHLQCVFAEIPYTHVHTYECRSINPCVCMHMCLPLCCVCVNVCHFGGRKKDRRKQTCGFLIVSLRTLGMKVCACMCIYSKNKNLGHKQQWWVITVNYKPEF